MENRGSRPFGYWDSSYRAKLRRTWIALPFCIVAAVAMPIFTAVRQYQQSEGKGNEGEIQRVFRILEE